MKHAKKLMCLTLVLSAVLGLCACGQGKAAAPNAATAAYDDVVAYLKEGGVIADETGAVDINTTEGYVTDNTGGDFAVAEIADKAYDYDGLWLLWWDVANESELYQSNFQYIEMNEGIIVIQGGAATLQAEAYKGAYAIAFAEDYGKKDEALKLFNAMTEE